MKKIATLISFITLLCLSVQSGNAQSGDRELWADFARRLAEPVLGNMAEGKLSANMLVEVSPTWDGRSKGVTYMETFGRLMAGIAPWLALEDDGTAEGELRSRLRAQALRAYAHAVDPESPDYLVWSGEGQALVDAAYIANSFLRAPAQLWEPLDYITKERYIAEFKSLRWVDPPYTNWMLFSSMVEAFLLYADAGHDMYRIHLGLRKVEEWYVGDGWYSDGPHFAFDYYNSYVIQTMYVEILQLLMDRRTPLRDKRYEDLEANYRAALVRMQRFGEILERLVSPEGTFPIFGRSATYRTGVFQPLSLLALRGELPGTLSGGQVRAALTAVIGNMFSDGRNFNEAGFLTLGFNGSQPGIADWYTNNGSLYMASLVLLPLGLPADHPFWTDPAQDWTAKKAWTGQPFPRDHAIK